MKWEVNYISVADEVSAFHDMLLLPEVFDIWYLAYNIPRSFVWSANNADYQYHMKTDDESYVAVKRLIHELVIRNSKKPLYRGRIYHSATVMQWYSKNAKKNWFLCDEYIPLVRELVMYIHVLQPFYEIIRAIAIFC